MEELYEEPVNEIYKYLSSRGYLPKIKKESGRLVHEIRVARIK